MSGTDEMRGIIRPTDVPAFGAYLLTFAPGTLLVDVAVALDRLDHAVPVHRVVLTSRSNQDHAGMRTRSERPGNPWCALTRGLSLGTLAWSVGRHGGTASRPGH